MASNKGRKTKVEIALTFATPLVLAGITNASPPVLSYSGPAQANGAIGYVNQVVGMEQILNQAISVDAPGVGTFSGERVKTTDYGVFVSGTFLPVASWATLSKSTRVGIAGGAGSEFDNTTLLDEFEQKEAGNLAAQTVSIDGFSDFALPAMQAIETAAGDSALCVFRITLEKGERRIFCGVPNLPGEEISVGANATGGFTVNVKGRVLFLPAA